MNKKDSEIQRKLEELESTILKETEAAHPPATINKDSELLSLSKSVSTNSKSKPDTPVDIKNEISYFGGISLILVGLFMFFQHVRVTSPFMNAFGMGGGGFGLLLLPLMVGLGWLIYDSRNKMAWFLTAGTCALIVFSVLSSLVMNFPPMSLVGMIIMLLPFAAGGALLLKGIGGPKAIQSKLEDRS